MKLSVDYTVNKVTVYPDRARITCLGKVNLKPDITTLIFNELPLTLDPDSLRVTGKGIGKVQVLGLDLKIRHYVRTPSKQVKELEIYLDQLKDDLKSLDDQYDVWNGQLSHLQGLREATNQYAKGLSRGQSNVDDQKRLMLFIREQDEEFRSAQRDIEKKRRDVKNQISKTESELADVRSGQERKRFQVLVKVKVIEAGDFQPELEYIVGSAQWKPVYDVFLEEDSKINIHFMAQVAQKTGQEWKGVQLSISTARPALNKSLPELTPWFIDERRALKPGRENIRAAAAAPAFSAMAQADDAPPPGKASSPDTRPADILEATKFAEGTSQSFEVSGSWDIPSDGSPLKTLLMRYSTAVDINYLTIPKVADAVYRRAKFRNNSGSSFLQGEAALFVQGEFIGSSKIDFAPVDSEIELLMGMEEQVTVKREMTKRQVDKRLLRENRVQRYGYKIELHNLKDAKIDIEVQDHIPVSKHEQIKVKFDMVRPEPDEKSDLNLLKWFLSLDPESEQSIMYEFVLEYPSTFNLSGIQD